MNLQSPGQTMAELTTAATLQTEASHQRVVFACGQRIFIELYRVWAQLDTDEGLAYEDKVAAQVHVLDEATASLGQLYHSLGRTCRRLKRHLQSLHA